MVIARDSATHIQTLDDGINCGTLTLAKTDSTFFGSTSCSVTGMLLTAANSRAQLTTKEMCLASKTYCHELMI